MAALRVAYGDLIGGLSGDMFVGALIDLGLPLAALRSGLKKIPGLKFDIRTSVKRVQSLRAATFHVSCPANEPPRSWKQIRDLIDRSKLPAEVRITGSEIFERLAQAEARVHGIGVDQVHFHEIGATDSIVDIIAAAIAVRELGIGAFHFSPIPLGRGIAPSQHGPLPVPGPATLELLRGLPVVGVDIPDETVTPTGAALIRTLGKHFGPPPAMKIERVGYGAGRKQFASRPNLFRVVLGEPERGEENEEMVVIETNIDDLNPQFYDHVMERLFAAGARDVSLAPIQMKKNRPATLLRIIAEPRDREKLAAIVLQETSTIGVRYYPVRRMILKRQFRKIKTPYGEVRMKIVEQPDGSERATAEYDDLKRIAAAKKLPISAVEREVARAAGRRGAKSERK